MDRDSHDDDTTMPSISDVLSFIGFIVTAYYVLRLFSPSQDAALPGPSPGRVHMGGQELRRASEARNGDQSENTGTERDSVDEDGYGVRHNEREESFGVEEREIDDLFFSEGEEGRVTDSSEHEDQEEREEEGRGEEEEEKEAEPEPSRKRSKIPTAANNPTSPTPRKKQIVIGQPWEPPLHLLRFGDPHYRIYDATTQNQGAAVVGRFMNFSQFDDYALYINPDLEDTELEQIPHSGVRVDDLTASKVLSHYGRKILRTRWPAEFDQQGMIRATRVPLGRAAKRWVDRGERDVDEKLVEEAGWYYLSWGGIHTLMGKEGLDVRRYRIRPSFESFKCPGLGFKISDWAEVQLAPEDPADPTFL